MTCRRAGRGRRAAPALAAAAAAVALAWPRAALAQEPGPLALDVASAPLESGGAGMPHDRVLRLGPSAALRASSAPAMEFPFGARADEEIVGARVRVTLASRLDVPVDVEVNGERIATLRSDAIPGAAQDLAVDPVLLGARDQLTLRVRTSPGRACAVPPQPWRAIHAVELTVHTRPVGLPDELAMLPLPFVDQGFDTAVTIPIVTTATRPDRARLAGLVASWFAVDAPIPVRFTSEVGLVPDGRAIVLVDGPDDAAALGVPAPQGPSIRMLDHPRHPGSNVKLLVIGGRTPAELAFAVETLARATPRLAGAEARLGGAAGVAAARATSSRPDDAPRWYPPGVPVRLTQSPGHGSFSVDGVRSGTIAARFRVAPDLWIWPSTTVALDLGWEQRVPKGMPHPRLDVELNGYFLATLPALEGDRAERRNVRLAIPREHMRGFNELLVHVRYPDPDPCAQAGATGRGAPPDAPHVALTGDSVLHLERFSLFATQPDVARFAYDGYPFTRVADLGDTVFVLPDQPGGGELAAFLSMMARFAQITGRVGWRVEVIGASAATDARLAGRDVIAVGGVAENPLVARWSASAPVAFGPDGGRVQPLAGATRVTELLGGLGPVLETRRAEELLGRGPGAAAIVGLESPVTRGRTAFFVTASTSAHLPPFERFLGYAESRSGSADVLVVAGAQRAMFRIRGAYGRGSLDAWTRLRWFLANHWLTLLPVVVIGSVVTAAQLRGALDRRMRDRLAEEAR